MQSKWPMVKLGEVLTVRTEKPDLDKILTGEIPIVAKIGFNTGKIELREEGKTKTGMILIKPGDLVISGINAAKGAIAIYGEENTKSAAATIHYSSYSINNERADSLYLWYFFRSEIFRKILIANLPNGIKTEVKPKRLLPIEIPLPSLEEQKRIVARIESLMARIEEARRLRAEAVEEGEEHIERVKSEIFEKLSEKSYETEIGESDISLNPENVDPKEKFGEKKFIYIDLSSVAQKTGEILEQKEIIGLNAPSRAKRKMVKGDVVFGAVRPNLKRCFIVDEKLDGRICSTGFTIFRVSVEKMLPDFLKYHLLSDFFINQCVDAATGAHYPAINDKNMKKLKIVIPPLPVQRSIVAYLDSLQVKVDELKKLQAETEKEMEELVPSILDKAFKGEL